MATADDMSALGVLCGAPTSKCHVGQCLRRDDSLNCHDGRTDCRQNELAAGDGELVVPTRVRVDRRTWPRCSPRSRRPHAWGWTGQLGTRVPEREVVPTNVGVVGPAAQWSGSATIQSGRGTWPDDSAATCREARCERHGDGRFIMATSRSRAALEAWLEHVEEVLQAGEEPDTVEDMGRGVRRAW